MNIKSLAAIAVLLLPAGGSGRSRTEAGVFRAGTVTVTVNRVRRIDPMDSAPDPGADFYARVTIGHTESTSPVIESRDDVAPQWTFTQEVGSETIPIVIKLFDKDGTGSDDHCDINPRSGARDISIRYDLRTGRFAGDVTGLRERLTRVHGAGDTKRAEIWFTVSNR